MDTNNAAIIEAQREIIADLVIWELKVAELYELYARNVPSLSVEWRKLAREEKQHAAMLKTLNRQLDQGNTFENIGHFRKDFVAEHLDQVENAIQTVETNGITVKESVKTSLRLETSMAESRFYKTVHSNAPEFDVICKKLAQVLDEHVAFVSDITIAHLGKSLTDFDRYMAN